MSTKSDFNLAEQLTEPMTATLLPFESSGASSYFAE